jgi:hypothetical protein
MEFLNDDMISKNSIIDSIKYTINSQLIPLEESINKIKRYLEALDEEEKKEIKQINPEK